MAPKAVLFAAIILCMRLSKSSGQEIIPFPTIPGNISESVLIMCRSFVPDQSLSNTLQIYQPNEDSFTTFSSSRLQSNNEIGGSITNYTFGPLNEADNGTIFRCSSSARNSGNSTVIVNFPPTITSVNPPGEEFIRLEGEAAFVVEVMVTGNPLPTFTWTVNGSSITDSRITVSGPSIMFGEVRREHAGNYTLTVMNAAGTDTHSFYLSVTFVPEFTGSIQEDFNCSTQVPVPMPIPCASYPGRSGQLLCGVDGNPTPTVNASTEGVVNTDNVDLMAGTAISITSVVADNAGYYICSATSDIGTATRRFRFYVGGTPQGVSNVSNISVVGDDVRITVVYNNSVNLVPATTIYAEMFLRGDDNTMIVWQDYRTITSSVYYTFTVPVEIVTGLVVGDYTARTRVENLQGNSTAVDGLFTISRSIVLAGSPLVSLLFLAVALLFH